MAIQTIVPYPTSKETKQLTPADFAQALGEPISDALAQKISDYGFDYLELTRDERDECIRVIVDKLLDPRIDRSGGHRLELWEKGWGENLEMFKEGIGGKEALVPKYFDKYDVVRWKQEFVKVLKPDFEYQMLAMIEYWLFEKYLKDARDIYEFGCGTGHNLLRAREVNAQAKLTGLDWATASQRIIAQLVKEGVLNNATGHRFDFFHPDHSLKLAPGAAVYSIAALEQVGTESNKFVDYLLANKPKICVHVEPTFEVLDEKHLLDYLAIQYYKKRNYLWGFLTYLRELEEKGKIVIHQAQRTYLGHFLTEGYTAIVWSPK